MSLIAYPPSRPAPSLNVEEATWEIDSLNGSDGASGRPGYPLADFAGFKYNTRGQVFAQNTTVDVLNGTDENVSLCPELADLAVLCIQATPTVTFSGTLTVGTLEWSDSGHQEVNATCAALPTSWTASGLIDGPIRNTAVAHAGNITWPFVDIGSKTARCPGWTAPGGFNDTGISGDTFEALSLVRCIGSWHIETHGSGVVLLKDIELGSRDELHGVEISGIVTAFRSRLNGTDINPPGSLYVLGSYVFDGCRVTDSIVPELSCFRRTSGSPIDIRGGKVYAYEQNVAHGPGVALQQNASLVVDASGSLSISGAAFALTLLPHSSADLPGTVWSRDASGRILSVGSCASVTYGSGRAPLNVGTGSPTLLVLAGASFASLPRTDTTNLCCVVVRV